MDKNDGRPTGMEIDLGLYDRQEAIDQISGNPKISLTDAIEAFQDEIELCGYGRPPIRTDGGVNRFDLPDDKKGKKSGWYVFHPDGVPAGAYGSWKDEETSITWCSMRREELSGAEWAEVKEKQERAKAARDAERERLAKRAKENAINMLEQAEDPDPDHPYLKKKQVKVFGGIKELDNVILIPIFAEAGDIQGLQRIFPNGDKKMLFGTRKKGSFGWIEGDLGTVYIAEGYSTAASVHMATGYACAIAIDAGNMRPVAETMSRTFPQSRLVVAADNDRWKSWNAGLEKGQQAAKAVGADIVWPDFHDLSTKPTDFNDLHVLQGLDEVRAQVTPIGAGPRISDWSLNAYQGPAKPVDWLVQGILPRACPCILAAAGGTGKGMLTLDLALKVASGNVVGIDLGGDRSWMGSKINGGGRCVIVTAEDAKDEVHRRLESIDPAGSMRQRAGDKLYVVPLPNAGGPIQIVRTGDKGELEPSPAFQEIRRQLRRIPDLALVNFDPLAAFVSADINADPQAAQYVMGLIASLAEETGACILVAHHLAKERSVKEWSADHARMAIRGTSAIVDGVRVALAIWPAGNTKAAGICRTLEIEYRRSMVFEGAVVKANVGPADEKTRTLVRAPNGLLTARDTDIKATRGDHDMVLYQLEQAIKRAAVGGRPFTKTGQAGVYQRREELPEQVSEYGGRNKIEQMVQDLLAQERVVGCSYKSSPAKWLDVPGGPFAEGTGEIEPGWRKDTHGKSS